MNGSDPPEEEAKNGVDSGQGRRRLYYTATSFQEVAAALAGKGLHKEALNVTSLEAFGVRDAARILDGLSKDAAREAPPRMRRAAALAWAAVAIRDLWCSVCWTRQVGTTSGITCANGHGGAAPISRGEAADAEAASLTAPRADYCPACSGRGLVSDCDRCGVDIPRGRRVWNLTDGSRISHGPTAETLLLARRVCLADARAAESEDEKRHLVGVAENLAAAVGFAPGLLQAGDNPPRDPHAQQHLGDPVGSSGRHAFDRRGGYVPGPFRRPPRAWSGSR